MPRFILRSKAKPNIRNGQQTLLYEAMQSLGGSAMFDEIAAKCKQLGYARKITPPVTVHASVMHHLHQWERRNSPIVAVKY